MSAFTTSVRFLAGMGLLAGGAILVHPLAEGFLRSPERTAAAARVAAPQRAAGSGVAGAVDGWSVPPAALGGPPQFADAATVPDAAPAVPPPPEAAYVPPPVPARLPRADLVAAAPDLAYAYRSTVDIPPPPLLDTQSPPPLGLTWETHVGARSPATGTGPVPLPAAAVVPQDAWGARIVRDGDDLTSIALEVYGHAAAAAAIHEANADAISDPQVLPIGLVLRLPPSWTLPSTPATHGPPAIEPAKRAANAGAAATPGPDVPAAGPAAWLAMPPAAPAAPAPTGPATDVAATGLTSPGPQPPPRPASVRAAPGDTLEAIAERFYGDRSAARRIWLANRDRLRSPALVVPGMEISLP